jgi:hypothetical protein
MTYGGSRRRHFAYLGHSGVWFGRNFGRKIFRCRIVARGGKHERRCHCDGYDGSAGSNGL